MAYEPTALEIQAFAARHSLTDQQARSVLADHGSDESAWDETVRNLIHFLKSPS